MTDTGLSAAVIAYVGVPGRLDAESPEDRVVKQVGAEEALALLPQVKAILKAMDEADPPLWDADTPAQMGDRVASWLQTRHPDLSSEAVKAVANDFTFSWK